MAVKFGDKVLYSGAVVAIYSRSWLDGMLSEYAVCWDSDKKDFTEIEFGYYGINGTNLAGGTCKVDINVENARDIIRSEKRKAILAYAEWVAADKRAVKANRKAEVVKGRKVPKGTILDVFWVGERETYCSRQYSWMHETEKIAGCHDKDGNKVWIKADYLKNVTPVASPNKTERRKFINRYVKGKLNGTNVLAVATGQKR